MIIENIAHITDEDISILNTDNPNPCIACKSDSATCGGCPKKKFWDEGFGKKISDNNLERLYLVSCNLRDAYKKLKEAEERMNNAIDILALYHLSFDRSTGKITKNQTDYDKWKKFDMGFY